jgi:hypothetical protein
MNVKELTMLDNSLKISDKKDDLLIKKRGYYIYYNEPNKKTKEIKIHKHICGFCAWGTGRDISKEPGRNGVWIGPFETLLQSEIFINKIIKPDKQSHHTCV